jgi:hypothetical protein
VDGYMKNKILVFVLAGLMLIPTAAYGKNLKDNPKDKAEIQEQAKHKTVDSEKLSNDDKKIKGKDKAEENKAIAEEFKFEMSSRHKIMKANTKNTAELRKEINTKKQELASILADIKLGNKTLSKEQLDLLTAKSVITKDTDSNINNVPNENSDLDDIKEGIKGKKFKTALSSLDSVIAKQENRYSKLVELNAQLDELLAIARQAQNVTPNVTTGSAISANIIIDTTSTISQ